LGKGLGGFLRQIVPDATLNDPVRIFAREFLGIGTAVRVWCTIGVTFQGDGGHGDDRTFSIQTGSAERECKGLHAGIQKLDLEPSISDRLPLADQLIQPRFGHRAIALLVNV
jgi:hypothetical protein